MKIYWLLFLVLLSGCSSMENGGAKDGQGISLEGVWRVVHLECYHTERLCNSGIDPRPTQTLVPGNLRKNLRYFFGSVYLEREFDADGIIGRSNPVFFATGISSSDRVFINGNLVGGLGNPEKRKTEAPLWMVPRQYALPNGLLVAGKNIIRIEIQVADELAGVFSGPVGIFPAQDIAGLSRRHYLWRLFLPIGIFFVSLAFALILQVAIAFRLLTAEYWYFFLVAVFYLPFALSYVPVPLPFDYLLTRKLTLAGGLATSATLLLFFASVLTKKLPRWLIITFILAMVFAALHFFMPDHGSLLQYSSALHPMVIFLLFIIPVIFARSESANPVLGRAAYGITGLLLLGVLANIHDYAIRIGIIDRYPLFNSFALIYPVTALLMPLRTMRILRSAAAKAELEKESERARIIRDVHDVVGAELVAMLQSSRTGAGKEKLVANLETNLQSLLDNLRESLYVWHGKRGHRQVSERMRDYLARLDAESRRRITAILHADPPGLSTRYNGEIYRIFLEALNNALRHSGGSEIKVRWQSSAAGQFLIIADNGIGSGTVRHAGAEKGIGLQSIVERASLVEGRLRIFTARGRGTIVSLWLKNPAISPVESKSAREKKS